MGNNLFSKRTDAENLNSVTATTNNKKINNFAIGVIIKNELDIEDEDKRKLVSGKVLVKFLYNENICSNWIPYITKYARTPDNNKELKGNHIGGIFRVPNVGSHVIIAFSNNNYSEGVVLGCIPQESSPLVFDGKDINSNDIIINGTPQVKLKNFIGDKTDKKDSIEIICPKGKEGTEDKYEVVIDNEKSDITFQANTFNIEIGGKLIIGKDGE